jgi:LL-diaminopimelate aminotransferase
MKTFQPASRLAGFEEYIFSKLAKTTARVERESGRPVLNFGAGTPDVKPSRLYSRKLAELVQAADAHVYPGYGATEAFSQALRGWYRRRFQVELQEDELLPLNGAKDGISHLPLALLDEGDEILVPDPGYPAFSDPARMVGARPVAYDLFPDNGFKLDLTELKQKVSERTKFIWVNFPSNPTGQVAAIAELEELVKFARRHGLFILYDNAYVEITFGGAAAPSILKVKGAKDLAVEIGSFSKAFSFAGLRMGWIAGNPAIIAALAKVKSQMDSGLSLPLQGLAAYALSHRDPEWQANMIKSYKDRRDIIAKHLRTLGLTFTLPSGSLYIWARIPDSAKGSETFCERILEDKQILLTPGRAFGRNGERYVRTSICANIDRINDYF